MADDTYSRGYRSDPYDRGGTGASGPAADPLTELARLIGQSDPFALDRNRQPDPRQVDPHQIDPRHPANWSSDQQAQHPQHYDHGAQDERYGGTGEQQHYADHRYGEADADAYQNGQVYPHTGEHGAGYGDATGYGEQAYHQDQQAHHQDQPPYYGEGGYDAAQPDPHGGYVAPPFYGADANAQPDDYYEDEPAPRRGWLVTAAALVGLAVVGTAGAFAYRAVFTGGQPSIITRDIGPSKITPAAANLDSGSNKGNDRLASAGQNERLGPPPEQPIAIPDPARTAPPPVLGQSQNPAPPMPALTGPSQPMLPADTAGPGNGVAPRKVRIERIKPDQLGDSAATRPVGPPQPRVAPAPNASNAPLSLAPQGISNAPAPAPAAAPAPPMNTTALAPAPAAADRGGAGGAGYYVQVSAQKSEDEAKSSFRSIQARHASLLGGQQPVIRRKDLGTKGVFYGAQVGPFSREAASKLCEDLKAAGQACMIQKN
jgi:SPOR domain